MDIIVKSRNCEVPERVKEEALTRVAHATRFFDRLLGVEVLFAEEQNPRIAAPALVELTARTKGHHIRAEGAGEDHRGAIDEAMGKFERQLAKYKARLVDRRRRQPAPAPSSTALLRPNGASPAATNGWPEPNIVRTKRFELVPMLPEDAALQLELLGHEFYVFQNAFSGECNVLYRRKDGDLGLIEAVPATSDHRQTVR